LPSAAERPLVELRPSADCRRCPEQLTVLYDDAHLGFPRAKADLAGAQLLSE
jgi:hypothetical protein